MISVMTKNIKKFHFPLISFFFLMINFCLPAAAAVILQYHHVSENTPKSTSITPAQFEKHLQYLADEGFRVVALSTLIHALEQKAELPDKTVAITFDDGYIDNLTYAKPLLDKFNYPFTIFINPAIIDRNSDSYLSWQQLKALADQGVIIANHGFNHDSLARIPQGLSQQAWLEQRGAAILKAEEVIKQHTGQSWRYFAYPYGEFTQEVEQWLSDNNFIAFGQQSGAVGSNTRLTSIPRFPASQPYDKLAGLRDKLNSLPLAVEPIGITANALFKHGELTSAEFKVISDDINPKQLSCYVTGIGRQNVVWSNDSLFKIVFNADLPSGRVRANCTAPSIEHAGRYYWYSQAWMILKPNGDWYPL